MSENKQAYISHVHLKGYKSIRDMEIDLLPGLNIIIGPNGSGKTNFIDGLLEQALAPKFNQKTFSMIELRDTKDDIYTWLFQITKTNNVERQGFFDELEAKGKGEIRKNNKLIAEFNDVYQSYRALQENLKADFFKIFNPTIIVFGNIGNTELLNVYTGIKIDFQNKNISGKLWIRPFEKDIVTDFNFNINTFENFKESTLIKEFEFKKEIIENLVKFTPIKAVKLKDQFVFNKNPKNKQIFVDFLLLEFQVNDAWFTWNELSDGTKRIFTIITKIVQWNGLILLEEPELGIHPDQLYLLMDFLKEQSKEKQIIITTHSPEVINILNKDELDRIIVTRYDAEKGTQMHNLSPKQIRKGQIYMKEVGYLSNFWVHSNLEEYEEQDAE